MGTTFNDKVYILKEDIEADEIQIGDLTVKRDEHGISIFSGGKSICFFNEGGMVALLEWLKNQETTYKEVLIFNTQEELNKTLDKNTGGDKKGGK